MLPSTMFRRTLVALFCATALLTFVPSPVAGSPAVSSPTQMAPSWLPASRAGSKPTPPPLFLAERAGVSPLAALSDAETGAGDRLAGLRAWNEAGHRPFQSGLVRALPLEQTVRFDGDLPAGAGPHDGGFVLRSGSTGLVWGAEVTVDGAYRVKLHLRDVRLPEGARMWVYDELGTAKGPFGSELVVEGALWTPAVRGPAIRLEVELPDRSSTAPAAAFTIDAVAQILRLDALGGPGSGDQGRVAPRVDTSCLANAECVSDLDVPPIDAIQAATALLFFVDGNRVFDCSGGLLNSNSGLPFFLTANHCISTRASAASADLFWDYWQECGGDVNDDISESFGAELLATGTSSDFTLMLLDFVPTGRALLGWNANSGAVAPGTVLHRVSHPADENGIFPQGYSKHRLLANPQTCSPDFDGRPFDDLTKFGYSETLEGGSLGGSSGAPLVNDDGQVVGQLYGGCGPNPTEGCDRRNNDLDGLFRETYQFISSYLLDAEGDGFVPPPAGPWLSSSGLPGFDAKVRITGGSPIAGTLEPDCIPETLCVSGALAGRSEVFVKVIGPRPNGRLWAQISRFSPAKLEIWLRQLGSGEINYYILDAVGNDASDVSGLQDREAFLP